MDQNALEFFGEMLMSKVRDESISEWDKILKGQMKSIDLRLIHERIMKTFDETQVELFHELIPEVVDLVLHNLLFTLETEESVDLKVRVENKAGISIRELSDGLAGELYTEDGWIARFSKERYRMY